MEHNRINLGAGVLGAALAFAILAFGCANTAHEPTVTLHTTSAGAWTESEDWFRTIEITLFIKVNKEQSDKFIALMRASSGNRRSPYFRQGISNEEYRRRFWPPPDKIQALTDWLSNQGFAILEPTSAGLRVSGWVTTAEKAFAIKIVRSPDGRCYANQTEPQIPARFADLVEAIAGLSNCSGGVVPLFPQVPNALREHLRKPGLAEQVGAQVPSVLREELGEMKATARARATASRSQRESDRSATS